MHSYEVEVKSLLGDASKADALRKRMCEIDEGAAACVSKNKQLNHYFTDGDLAALAEKIGPHLSDDARARLGMLAEEATEFSVRTRDKDGEIFVVVKASVDDTTSDNGIARIEFEESVGLSLGELDQLILDAGFSYQAKWSREREEYVCRGTNVCLDRNAGYGYLAEFEKMTDAEGDLPRVRDEIYALMRELGVEELPQDRLARMFDHYNKNWPEYYGTEKIFVIE